MAGRLLDSVSLKRKTLVEPLVMVKVRVPSETLALVTGQLVCVALGKST